MRYIGRPPGGRMDRKNNDTTLVERIDDVGSFLRRPGKWHTSTGHPAYPVLKALAWHPNVHMGEELFFPEGSVIFAEVRAEPSSRMSQNPDLETVGWGTVEDYYEKRLRDYDHWEMAFWRELIQNSRDAGARNIEMECVPDTFTDPETEETVECVRCTARDDGRGMDYETLMGAFFRRGGTQKSAGSVGGFGDAKNLILTPWLGYRVRTRDIEVQGRHESLFAALEKRNLPMMRGTEITVWMPATSATTDEFAQHIVEMSSVDTIRFKVNGKTVRSALPKGSLISDTPITIFGRGQVGNLLVYHSPRAKKQGVYVRSQGIFMYAAGASGDWGFKGVVTAEVNAPPLDVFTTKRDQLSYGSSARDTLDTLLKKLSSDPRSSLKRERDKKELVFRGGGLIEVRQGAVAEMAAEAMAKAMTPSVYKKLGGGDAPMVLDTDTITFLTDAILDVAEGGAGGGGSKVAGPLADVFKEMARSTTFVNVEQLVRSVELAMWDPDFFILQNISPWHLPKALHPDSLGSKYHQLIGVWTEICRFVMVQLGVFKPFGVGWIFDSETDPRHGEVVIAAAHRRHDGQDWLLLNPLAIKPEGYGDSVTYKTTGDRYDLKATRDMEDLVTLAVHEITHMQGFHSHDEAYANALTDNMKAIFRIGPVLKKVVRAARKAVREERKAKQASKPASKAKWKKGALPRAWEAMVETTQVKEKPDGSALVTTAPLLYELHRDGGDWFLNCNVLAVWENVTYLGPAADMSLSQAKAAAVEAIEKRVLVLSLGRFMLRHPTPEDVRGNMLKTMALTSDGRPVGLVWTRTWAGVTWAWELTVYNLSEVRGVRGGGDGPSPIADGSWSELGRAMDAAASGGLRCPPSGQLGLQLRLCELYY